MRFERGRVLWPHSVFVSRNICSRFRHHFSLRWFVIEVAFDELRVFCVVVMEPPARVLPTSVQARRADEPLRDISVKSLGDLEERQRHADFGSILDFLQALCAL